MDSTKFWEIAGLVLSLAQMILYISGFNKHRKRLDSLSDELRQYALERFAKYQELRETTLEYQEYYKNLPEYTECENDVLRSKGKSFFDYGDNLRRAHKTVRGFSQAQKVTLAYRYGADAIAQSAMSMTMNKIKERRRVDEHLLRKWETIVTSPTYPAHNNDMSDIIKSSFSSLRANGKGFNSAGISFGTSLYKILK